MMDDELDPETGFPVEDDMDEMEEDEDGLDDEDSLDEDEDEPSED